MTSRKLSLSMAWIFLSETMLEKAPSWEHRFDNGRVALDLEASIGQVVGFGACVEAKQQDLPCGHTMGGARVDLYLFGLHLGLALVSSYKAHDEHHRELQAAENAKHPMHPLPITEEQLREADIEGLEELKAIANSAGVGVEQLINDIPEPMRSEMLRRLGISPDVPEVTAKQVNEALEAIRTGRVGQ